MKIALIPCLQQGSIYQKIMYLFASFLLLSVFGCTEEEVGPVAVASVTLDAASMELLEGESHTLTATVSPSNADNQKIIWASSNVSVASVKEGVVTALKVGNATITAKSDDGGKTATCEVVVNAKVYPVESISLDRTSVDLTEGDEITLTATVKPDNATDKSVSWSSSDPSVAEVVDGKVTALASGSATITVKTDDGGKTATCEVVVNAKVYPVESISLDRTSVDLTEGDEITLTATVKPDNATNKTVTWSSSHPSMAKVVDGNITALAPGIVVITVKTEDGGKTATCMVSVHPIMIDYIDEYGINHGQGVEVDGLVWAPVNCGYHTTDYKYGKLYQWGRKYGQGYEGPLFDYNGDKTGTYTDALVPSIASGPVSLSTGQSESNSNVFYALTEYYSYGLEDWITPQNDELWNSGTEESPIKTNFDPCPEGWRVPTLEELNGLMRHHSNWTICAGQNGYWFSGSKTYTESTSQVFLPAAGEHSNSYYKGSSRGGQGFYWVSTPDYVNTGRSEGKGIYNPGIESAKTSFLSSERANRYSVRCVQE